MIICIVGKSGCGKSYICELLKSYSSDIVHLDIDKIGHQVTSFPSVIHELVTVFGKDILFENSINRKALSKIVFNSKESMEKLTQITWKHMELIIDNFINTNSNKTILLDWQLLPKTKFFNQSDLKILVQSNLNFRMKMAMSRDKITKDEFLSREKASCNFDYKNFDYIINNDYSENINKIVREIYDKSIVSR